MNPDTPIKGAPFAAIDFESTGFAGPDTHVVEVAVVHGTFGSDDVRVACSTRVRPPVPIPEAASRVHGIFDADVAAAPTWAEVYVEVANALRDRLPVAYNAPADFLFWFAEFIRRRKGAVPEDWTTQAAQLWRAWRWLDLQVVRKATRTRGRPGKLVELAAEHAIALDAHGATGDALSTALLLGPLWSAAVGALVFRGPEGAQPWQHYRDLGVEEPRTQEVPETVGALLAWQRGAALFQEQSFADYQRREGRPPPQSYHHVLEGVEPPTWDTGPRSAPCRCGAPTLRRVGRSGALVTVNLDGSAHACPP